MLTVLASLLPGGDPQADAGFRLAVESFVLAGAGPTYEPAGLPGTVVKGLGSKRYATRQACQAYVNDHFDRCLPAVIWGMERGNPEVKSRCMMIWRSRSGIVPRCPDCGGLKRCPFSGPNHSIAFCPHCDGSGNCKSCEGTGKVIQNRGIAQP